jgi:phage shock protein A
MEGAQNRLRLREMYAGERTREAFARFELLERRVDLAEGHAEAMKMGGQPKTLEEEIAELRMSDKVEEELAALKAAQQGGAGTPAQKEDDAHG